MEAYTESMAEEATYWPPGSNDGFGGRNYGSPVLIACRWQDAQKLFRDQNGREMISEAIVYVDRELAASGRLVLGDATDSDVPPDGSNEIRQTGASPSLDGTQVLHKVWL